MADQLEKGDKRSQLHTDLTLEEEQNMVEWMETHPILYNNKITTYKDTGKKERMWLEKAEELGKSVLVLKTWYSTAENCASSATSADEIDEIPPDMPSIPKTTGLISKAQKHKHDTSETEDVLLAGIEDRSNKMMVLQQQVLEILRPVSSDRERDAFVDWIRTVITEVDHVVWRYIAENDQTKRAQSIPTPAIQPQLRQQMQPLQAQSSSYSAPWQPPPSQWHAQPSSNVSVRQSQDANWVSQQSPQPRQNMPQLQPSRSSSAGPSVPVSGWDGIANRSMTASPSPTRQAITSRTSQSSFHLSDLINISDPDPENV
ncbi:Hypothetical predicted protein [Mytilus galloprovincialis]|uniref:MADF domain-containing protein n=1 Tax=Mytilus galloprovincialis TaxID=29158 RepID=A0A8B6C4L1_MYTGA|nr:Hypothetical predicted protein [Mytilus galloprovincialis]